MLPPALARSPLREYNRRGNPFVSSMEINMSRRLLSVLLLLCALTALTGPGLLLAQDNVLVMARSADTTGLDPHTQTALFLPPPARTHL